MPPKRTKATKSSNKARSCDLMGDQKRRCSALTDSANRLNQAEMDTKLQNLLADSQLDAGLFFVSVGTASTTNTPGFDSQDPLGSLEENSPDLALDPALDENTPELQFEKNQPIPMDLSMHDSSVLEADLEATGKSTPLKSLLLPMEVDDDLDDVPLVHLIPSSGTTKFPKIIKSYVQPPEKLLQSPARSPVREVDQQESQQPSPNSTSAPKPSENVAKDIATADQRDLHDEHSQKDLSAAPSVTAAQSLEENSSDPETDWKKKFEKADAENRELIEKLKKFRKKITLLEEEKAAADDAVLRFSKKLLAIEDQQKIPMVSVNHSYYSKTITVKLTSCPAQTLAFYLNIHALTPAGTIHHER
ncbi:uncharacterized protein LOC109411757 [Aedes albopictus]|uniref:Uncharacterized protein n=1 Tax=Aedes albopictus TaxID=7160 RepID=A0ABM1YMP7_AEDAL